MDTLSDVKYIQRKILLKNLEVDPIDQALILNCEVEASLVSENPGDQFLEESREVQKIIKLKSLEETSDVDSIVSQVIAKSKGLLTQAQRDEVKQLIVYLKNRSSNPPMRTATGANLESFRPKTAGGRLTDSSRSSNGWGNHHNSSTSLNLDGLVDNNKSDSHNHHQQQRMKPIGLETVFQDIKRTILRLDLPDQAINNNVSNQTISINQLDDYIELLYEDYAEKMRGASMIYQLSMDHENLILLTNNEPLNCALSRLLREDGRKSIDLSTLLVAVFANFSIYRQFHPAITKYKVGALCLETVQSELEREEQLFRDLADIQATMSSECRSLSNSTSLHSSLSYSHLSTGSAPSILTQQRQSPAALINEYEKSLRKYRSMVHKQDLFLRAAFLLLLNLSEDRKIEQKMVNKGIVFLLVKSLDRNDWPQLLFLVVTFLKKLSVVGENKDQMIALGISEKLGNILDNQSPINIPHLTNTLELVYNLSFDGKFRHEMIRFNVIAKLSNFLFKSSKMVHGSSQLEKLIYQIMYLYTVEDKLRVMFNLALGGDRIHLLADRLIKYLLVAREKRKDDCPFMELMALLINLATNRRNAQLMCEKANLKKLCQTIVDNIRNTVVVTLDDILVLKLIRNISQHEDAYKMIFLDYLEQLVEILVSRQPKPIDLSAEKLIVSNNGGGLEENVEDMLIIEILGIIGNLANLPGVNWSSLASRYNLWKWLKSRLKLGDTAYEDDLVLECIMVLSTMCHQKECCQIVLNQGFLERLIEQINAKQEEDEIVLQIIFVFHVMLKEEDIRKSLIKEETQVMAYLFDLMNDKNPEIKKLCKQSLNIIFELEPEYAEKIKEERFKSYNKQWFEMIISRDCEEDAMMIMDDNSEDLMKDLACNNFLSKPDIFTESPGSSPNQFGLDDGCLDGEGDSHSRSISRPHTGYKTRNSSRMAKSGVQSGRRSINKSRVSIINL